MPTWPMRLAKNPSTSGSSAHTDVRSPKALPQTIPAMSSAIRSSGPRKRTTGTSG